jgi:hypothetical protein
VEGQATQSSGDKGRRALAVLGVLVLAFAAAVMIAVMVDIGGTPTCADTPRASIALGETVECFDGSSTQKTISLILGWPSGVLAGIAAVLLLLYTFTGRRGRLAVQAFGLALILGALSIAVGSV